jgi:hypothetical protein
VAEKMGIPEIEIPEEIINIEVEITQMDQDIPIPTMMGIPVEEQRLEAVCFQD